MRTRTLVLSIVIHLCVLAGVIVAPLFATDELPEPPRATDFVRVVAALPPEPAPPTAPRPATTTTSAAAPLQAPDAVRPESPVPQSPVDPEALSVFNADPGVGTFAGVVAGPVDVAPPPAPAPAAKAPVRVGSGVRPPQKIRDVSPRYPAIAQASRVEGLVILEAVIGEDGAVRDVRVLRSVPLLDEAAKEAVRQWQFSPTLLNGEPVPVVMTVTVSFTLH